MPRLLLTGGAGFIGSHLTRALLESGYEIDVVDDLSTGSLANVPEGASLHRLNLAGTDFLGDLPDARFDAVLHLAGQSSGEKSFDDPRYDFDANARSTAILAEWAVANAVPVFLHASSMGVYGDAEAPVAETAPLRPLSWYGGSKAAAEISLRAAQAQGLRVCSFRMFSVYGPGQNLDDLRQGMASIFLSYLLRGEPVLVKGPLDRVRDFVHVDDVVRAWQLALEGDASGPFNLGTGVGTTVGELIAQLVELCEVAPDHRIEGGERTPGDQYALWADIARARAELGWAPQTALRDGLGALVAWARG
ncbi:MAG: UDP-glucose 4-epimerase [Thermoleophilaceae bacterium]|nr:UDP-glucose 4-epimerase [Thermoleophilaceae bacterium]